MQKLHAPGLSQILKLLVCLLICKIIVSVLLNYRDYMPPNFDSNFLRGRERYFWGDYCWAFYVHIVSGPLSLILGTVQISEQFRQRFRQWHRYLGRIQVTCVILVVAPSGLWMAWHAASGPIAGVGFALLAVVTATTAALGWRAAVMRQFDVHRRWMWRCFLCLCSAVVIRVNGGLGEIAGIHAEWFYAQSAWTSWLAPLAAFELVEYAARNSRRFWTQPIPTPAE